jgi:TPP-dependent pyruvate/acetoin dehydrogenase alpha subunit
MNPDVLIEMYRRMVTIRRVDDTLGDLLKRGEISDHYPCAGEEAVAVGSVMALSSGDLLTSHYRGMGHLIARGADLRRILAEYYGKRTGYCKGKGGAKHVAAFDLGIYGAYSIVGASIPIAAGIALAAKTRRTGQVVACFFGDGASNQGTFHEGLNLAAILKLPVIYVCENNRYAQTTPVSYSLPIPDIATRGISYNIPSVVVDGMDVLAVHEAVGDAVERARSGGGPALIECKTYRYGGHFAAEMFIKFAYRSEAEIEEWKRKDPIVSFETRLKAEGLLSEQKISQIRDEVSRLIEEAVRFARSSPLPEPGETFDDLFSHPIPLP